MAARYLNLIRSSGFSFTGFCGFENHLTKLQKFNAVKFCSLLAPTKSELEMENVKKSGGKTRRKRNNNNKENEAIKLDLTETQEKNILSELNTRTLEQLTTTKFVGKNKAESLIQYRQDNGPLSNLQELAGIKGFGKAFYSRLEETGELPAVVRKFSRQLEVMNTLLSDDIKQCISSIISIDIGLQNAAWVHMDRACRVLAWQQVHITRPKPYNPAILKPQIQTFVDSLPAADAYVVEMQSHRVGKHAAALLPFVIHLRIIESMLHCLLPSPCVPFDPHYTSKHFGLPTGHSQKKKAAVSLVESLFLEKKPLNTIEVEYENYLKEQKGLEGSNEVVKNLVGGNEDLPVQEEDLPKDFVIEDDSKSVIEPTLPSFESKLQISPELIEYFKSCKKKDDLSDSLLQALAFYHLMTESSQ